MVNNSECSAVNKTKTCACTTGFKSISEKSCVENEIGDTGCTEDRECYIVISNSNCTDSTCYCNVGYYSSTDNDECILRTIGDGCLNKGDCKYAMTGSLCENGVCVCDVSYSVNRWNSGCVFKTINDSCTSYENCDHIEYSTCDINTKTCQCSHGYIQVGNDKCRIPILKEDSCVSDSQCTSSIANSICKNGTCQCLDGYDEEIETSICSPSKYSLKETKPKTT